MNKTKRILICATGLTLGVLSSSMAYGQGFEADGRLQAQVGLDNGTLNSASQFTASQKLIERASVNWDELSEEMQANLTALEDTQAEIVAAWKNEYKPDADATAEEIQAARETFEAEMSDQIELARELRQTIVVSLCDDLRARIGARDWSGEARAKFAAYRLAKAELNSTWAEVKANLGEDATRAEVAAAKQAFLESNAELVAQQKSLAAELRTMVRSEMRANRPQIDREAVPEAIAELRADIQLARGNVSERRKEIREEMENMSGRARAELRRELALELQASFDEIKANRRQLIDDLKGGQDGDRRPED